MSKPYDATTKDLLTERPRDLLTFLGLPDAARYEVEAIDADLSTVTAAADKILRVNAPKPYLAHVEAQSGPDATLDERTLHYNVLMGWQHKLRVRSVILLLRPEADSPRFTGLLELCLPDEEEYLVFRYRVVRVWQRPVEEILAGGLGALPLAPLSDVAESELPNVIARMKARIDTEATREDAGRLWASTFVLMGLRYSKETAIELLKGVRDMEESSTYQYILEKGEVKGRQEGRIEEARQMLLLIGEKRFGVPYEAPRARIESLTTREEIESLVGRLFEVENWSELFPS